MSEASWLPVPEGSGFGLDNLPLGIGARPGRPPAAHVAIGDHALDLSAAAALGCLDDHDGALHDTTLNRLLGLGRDVGRALRAEVAGLLTDRAAADRLADAVVPRDALAMRLPVAVGDYVDFYSSIHHATNLGRLLRPGTEPLPAAWRHLPIGYHGRAGSVVVSGTDVVRPRGLRVVDGAPVDGPSERLDIELEVGFVVGAGSDVGAPVPIDAAEEHIAGFCLVNDWSARDIQAFEYQPLGPFLGKSFATSMSPWIVSTDALAPHRIAPPPQQPAPAAHLQAREPWGLDLHLEVAIASEAMRAAGTPAAVVSRTCFRDMYWTPAQQLAHATANGAGTRPGDLFASGTVSGPMPGTEGSLFELAWGGERPIALPDGTTRSFLLDGDEVTLRGSAGGNGRPRVSLGEVVGRVVSAKRRS